MLCCGTGGRRPFPTRLICIIQGSSRFNHLFFRILTPTNTRWFFALATAQFQRLGRREFHFLSSLRRDSLFPDLCFSPSFIQLLRELLSRARTCRDGSRYVSGFEPIYSRKKAQSWNEERRHGQRRAFQTDSIFFFLRSSGSLSLSFYRLDFAVNDLRDDDFHRSFDHLLRALLTLPSAPAVVTMEFFAVPGWVPMTTAGSQQVSDH